MNTSEKTEANTTPELAVQTTEPAVESQKVIEDLTEKHAVGDNLVYRNDDVATNLEAGMTGYQGACFACHNTGVAGAPRIGDIRAWTPRLSKGLEGLTQSAIQGKGAMPPRGGVAYLSDIDMRNIVGYMMSTVQ